MSCSITYSESFAKDLKCLAKHYRSIKQDYSRLLESLYDNPMQGNDLGRGLRKVRMAISAKGKGKRGGARVITYVVLVSAVDTEVKLLAIYDKSEKSNISDAEIMELRRANGIV